MPERQPTAEEVAEITADAMKTALSTEVKARFGEDHFVKHSMVIALVERPRGDLEGPDAERFRLMIKNLEPVHPGIAVNMLREAAGQFQAKKSAEGG